ncbi:MAG TPA: amidohydrolase family protein [Candidatus Binatia bacterium]|nr:amidohydrolase family protein [Candidatus Binatia bacterium]
MKALLAAGAALLAAGCASFAQPGGDAEYDVVIRNGRVLDGAGNPFVIADVAILDGRFAKIGRVEGRGRTEIDAAGDYVTPGWIDVMDQSGEALLQSGLAENKLRQGVTTAIAGEGGTPVPAAGVDEFFRTLQKQGLSINWGTYYSATQARTEVMGDVAGTPTAEQLARMQDNVRQAMAAGAFGIADALIYPPGSFQSTEELIALATIAAQSGGIYASHIRNESEDLLKAVQEAIRIAEEAHIRVEIFHLKAAYAPGWGRLMPRAGAAIEAARARGVDIAADMYAYPAGGTALAITVPNHVFEEGADKGIEALRDPALRRQLKKEVAAGSLPGWSNLVMASGGWKNVVVANAMSEDYDRFNGQSVAQIARTLHRDPADTAWDIVAAAWPKPAMALFFMMSERDIETALRFPWTSIGSDASAAVEAGKADALGLPHPRSYGNAARVIAEYVKRRHVLTLEDAVRKQTSWAAARMGLGDRGVIREGLRADVTVFSYERLDDRASWKEPTLYPEGIDYVLVNGTPVIWQGRHTGAKPGVVLRGPGYAR